MGTGRRLGIAGLVSAALAAAGCGDGDPSAKERRAAMADWVRQADAACRHAEAAIVARGEPTDLDGVDRVIVPAVADARRAAGTIRRLRVPAGAADKVRPVLDALEQLERPARDIAAWSRVAKADELVEATKRWRAEAFQLERTAQEAGLKVCGRPGQRYVLTDAVIAPVFAAQLAEFQELLLTDIKAVRSGAHVTDRASLAAYLKHFSEVVGYAAQRYYALEPPQRAAAASTVYQNVLLRTGDLAGQWARAARRRPYTVRLTRSLDRRFRRLARAESRAAGVLARALRPISGRELDDSETRA